MLRLLLTALALARPQSSASAEPPGPGGGGLSDAFRPVGRVPYYWPGPYTTTTTAENSVVYYRPDFCDNRTVQVRIMNSAPVMKHLLCTDTVLYGSKTLSRDGVQREMDNLYNMLHWLRPPPMVQSTIAQPVMIKQPVVQPAMAEPVKTQQDQSSTNRLTKRQLKKEADPNADEWYKGKKKRTTVLATRSANV